MKASLAAAIAAAFTLIVAPSAAAHLVAKPAKASSLAERLELQEANVRHARGFIRWAERRRLSRRAPLELRLELRWARVAVHPLRGWLLAEVAKMKAAIAERERRRLYAVPEWPWGALAGCESGRTWDYNGSSGFDGGLQFLPSTWTTAAGNLGLAGAYPFAYLAPAAIQVRVAADWLSRTSWLQWPKCSRDLGLR